MILSKLDNLAKTGHLKVDPMNQLEFSGLLRSGEARLHDAANSSLAALRWYRSGNRYLVFQVLPHTIGVGPEVWRVLAKCHDCHNVAEYEGYFEIDEQLLKDLVTPTQILLALPEFLWYAHI
jgi:hypothetical protein